MKINRIAAAIVGIAGLAGLASTANATHSWANYHWARTTQTFTLRTLDSTTATSVSNWPAKLAAAASTAQWSKNSQPFLSVSAYDNSSNGRRKCSAVLGKIRVCNQSYGQNGWLGLASINISGDHITQGTAKMNDSYGSYWASSPGEDAHVMCQEVGHTFGLGHTSEDGTSQGTCMDYYHTTDGTTSTKPNAHDYAQLASIYSHTDSTTTLARSAASASQQSMAGQVPMGVRVEKGRDFEVWAAPDGHGGTWIHHVTLAPAQ